MQKDETKNNPGDNKKWGQRLGHNKTETMKSLKKHGNR